MGVGAIVAGDDGIKSRAQPDGTRVQLVGLDPANLDAFSRLRVSTPVTLFEAMFRHDLHPLWFEAKTATGGTVTHSPGQSSALLAVDTTDAASAVLQTRQYLPYQPGKSQLVAMTFTLGDPVANVRRRVGYFDAEDGVYLEQNGISGLSINLRSSITSAVLQSIEQADWNLDPMDGTGPSGATLDVSLAQILLVDFQFLGVGLVRVAFDIDGQIVPVHAFTNANSLTIQPYMRTASLPLRYEITNTAASAGADLQAICCQVMSEGGSDFAIGYNFASASPADKATSTTRAHLLSIRPAEFFPAGSDRIPRGLIIPLDISVQAASATVLVEVFYNPTYSGGTWAAVNANSIVEESTDATFSDPGIRIDGFYVAGATGASRSSGGNAISLQYPITRDIANANPRALMITATTVTGTGTARAVMSWREVR